MRAKPAMRTMAPRRPGTSALRENAGLAAGRVIGQRVYGTGCRRQGRLPSYLDGIPTGIPSREPIPADSVSNGLSGWVHCARPALRMRLAAAFPEEERTRRGIGPHSYGDHG